MVCGQVGKVDTYVFTVRSQVPRPVLKFYVKAQGVITPLPLPRPGPVPCRLIQFHCWALKHAETLVHGAFQQFPTGVGRAVMTHCGCMLSLHLYGFP